MGSLKVKAVAALMVKADRLNRRLSNIFQDKFGEVEGEAYYNSCNVFYTNYEKANTMIECKKVPSAILHNVVEQRGNSYDKLVSVLSQTFTPDEVSKITSIYRDLAETNVLVEKITTKNPLVAHRIAKNAIKDNAEITEITLEK